MTGLPGLPRPPHYNRLFERLALRSSLSDGAMAEASEDLRASHVAKYIVG